MIRATRTVQITSPAAGSAASFDVTWNHDMWTIKMVQFQLSNVAAAAVVAPVLTLTPKASQGTSVRAGGVPAAAAVDVCFGVGMPLSVDTALAVPVCGPLPDVWFEGGVLVTVGLDHDQGMSGADTITEIMLVCEVADNDA